MAWFEKTTGGSKGSWLREVTLAVEQAQGRAAGRDPVSLRPNAFLGADLGLSSIAVARLAGILRNRFGRKPLPFHTLFVKPDGTILRDIRVAELVVFLERHLGETIP